MARRAGISQLGVKARQSIRRPDVDFSEAQERGPSFVPSPFIAACSTLALTTTGGSNRFVKIFLKLKDVSLLMSLLRCRPKRAYHDAEDAENPRLRTW